MEKLMERLHSCLRALATLDEAVNMPFSVIVRDAVCDNIKQGHPTEL
ncbi:MAG: hypothetical protein H8D43_01375 [Chloroflexi bacterium]|nr:hypothetical protein [Chloroflexota bacterium]